MITPESIIRRARELGANIVLDGNDLRVVNKSRLPADALRIIGQHRSAIQLALRDELQGDMEERAAIIQYEAGAPRDWAEQFAKILFTMRPVGVSDLDWSWFITTCGQMIDAAPTRSPA